MIQLAWLRELGRGAITVHVETHKAGVEVVDYGGDRIFLALAIPAAENGNLDADKLLRQHVAERLAAGVDVPVELRDWLAGAGAASRPQGRPRNPRQWIDGLGPEISRAVQYIREERDCSKEEAVRIVADWLSASESTVWRAVRGCDVGATYPMPGALP